MNNLDNYTRNSKNTNMTKKNEQLGQTHKQITKDENYKDERSSWTNTQANNTYV